MPDIVWDGLDVNLAIPSQDPENFLDFHTIADGREIAARIEQKAVANGVDASALRGLGMPLPPQLARRGRRSTPCRPPNRGRSTQSKWRRPTIAMREGRRASFRAELDLEVDVLLAADLSGRARIVIEHRYRPSVGETAER